jgi:hypothetical protein
VACLAAACGNNVHAPLTFEFASSTECDQASGALPVDLQYYTLQVCASDPPGDCVPLVDPSGDHAGATSDTISIRRSGEGRFTVDANVSRGTLYDVTVYAYEGTEGATCHPSAVGRALGVRFGQDAVRIRLHPFDVWSCAGVHEGEATTVPRGLHQAVLLPNREVLLLGGVTSPSATAAASGFGSPIGPQTAVEVFDPRDARFHAVSMNDEDGMPGLSRVMFEARYIRMTADGRYEVRLFGGFDPRAAAGSGIGFDATAITSDQSALFGPVSSMASSDGHGFRSDATLIYDPQTRSATLAEALADGSECATTAASDGPSAIAAVCSIESVTHGARPEYDLAAAWYPYAEGNDTIPMMAGRIGASITELSATRYLVWGGDVAMASGPPLDAAAARSLAGEVVGATEDTPVAGHDPALVPDDGRPWATAYHTATRIEGPAGAVSILFAGGLVPGGNLSPLAVPTMTPAGDRITVARFGPDGVFRSGERVATGTTMPAALLQTATPLDAMRTRVLIAGGALVNSTVSPVATLYAVVTVGIVSFDRTTGTYAWSDVAPLRLERWGHSTTMIPGYGVLVAGGLRRMGAAIEVLDRAEFLLEDDLPGGTTRPPNASCDGPPDAGMMARDAGPRDAGPRDGGGAMDAGPPDAAIAAEDVGIDAP